MELKQTLIELSQMNNIERKAYLIEHSDELLNNMLSQIGSIDAELRDHYIYSTFLALLRNNLLTDAQLVWLFEKATSSNYLYKGIGELGTDTVFTRSFTALLVADILSVDAEKHFLPTETLEHYFEKCTHYLLKERDTSSFVDGKGLAQSIAHGADLATASINHPAFEMRMAPMMLQAVKACLWKDTVYVNDEEERLINVVEALIHFGMPEEVLIEWVEQVFDKLNFHLETQGYNEAFFKGRTCTLNFMKTFFFILKTQNLMSKLQNVVYISIGKWLKLS